MKINLSIKIFILLIFYILFISSCGIPQVLPFLNIPVAQQNSYNIESELDFLNTTIIYTVNNKEEYFKGYYFYYSDTDGYWFKGKFAYFDSSSNKFIYLDNMPLPSELSEFKQQSNFNFTFHLNYNFIDSSYKNIRDTYILVQDDENELTELYKSGKKLTIYLIPLGEDENGLFIYTPATTTSQNRVIFNFK